MKLRKVANDIKIGIRVPTDRVGMDGINIYDFVETKIETILDLEKLIEENINRRLTIFEDGVESTYEITYQTYNDITKGVNCYSRIKTTAYHTQRLWDDVFEGRIDNDYKTWT